MPTHYDAIVLGAGVIGCATAFNLARAGARVAVLEKAPQVAAGATSRSSACLRLHYTVPENARIARAALDYFNTFRDQLRHADADAGFVRCGHMLVGSDNETGRRMRSTVGLLASQGFNTRMLDGKPEAAAIHPLLDLEGAAHIGWEPDSGVADPYMTATSFKAASQGTGAGSCEYHFNCTVTGLLAGATEGSIRGVTTSDGDFQAGVVVSCLNLWTPSTLGAWLTAAGLLGPGCAAKALPVALEKHHLIAVRGASPYLRDKAQFLPNVKCLMQESQPYFRAYDGGSSILVGNNHPEHVEQIEAADADDGSWDETVTLDQQVHCATLAATRFSGMEEAEIVASWSGIYDVSPDWSPILGRVPGVDNLVVACGFSGHGFKLSPIVGQMLAAEALRQDTPKSLQDAGVDIRRYSVTRFERGAELRGAYLGAGS